MQKPTFFNPSTFIRALALTTLAAVTVFLSPGRTQQASSAVQDSSAPAKPADKTTDAKATPAKPDAKASAKKPSAATSAAKPSAAGSATKPAAPTTGSQANAPAKASSATGPTASQAPTASASHAPAASAPQSPAGTPKKPAATKTGQGAGAKSPAALTLKTPKDKTSYAIGINVGKGLSQNLKQAGIDIDPAVLTRAVKDVLAGEKPLMTDDEAKATLTALQTEMREAQAQKAKQLGDANKKEGDEFLASNKIKEGVTSLPDGLQYKVLQEGTGPKPTAADSVTVNYRGTLVNGTEFDSSYKRNQPAQFPVAGTIIKGWTEALELMPVGSKWQIFIPSELAYGPQGRPPVIGPSSTLIFELELLSVQPKPATPAPAAAAPASPPAPTAAAAPNAPVNPSPAPAPNAPPTPAPKPTPPAPNAPAPKPQTP